MDNVCNRCLCSIPYQEIFLQNKLEREINVGFLLNELGDLHFLLHSFGFFYYSI